eukprot:gene19792-20272_t
MSNPIEPARTAGTAFAAPGDHDALELGSALTPRFDALGQARLRPRRRLRHPARTLTGRDRPTPPWASPGPVGGAPACGVDRGRIALPAHPRELRALRRLHVLAPVDGVRDTRRDEGSGSSGSRSPTRLRCPNLNWGQAGLSRPNARVRTVGPDIIMMTVAGARKALLS